MFNKDSNKIANRVVLTRIDKDTSIVGTITSAIDIRIDGTVRGIVKSDRKICIGENGRLIGNAICKDMDILGTVEGDVEVENRLQLTATARFQGDIKTGKLSVEAGAKFDGTCQTYWKKSDAASSQTTSEKRSAQDSEMEVTSKKQKNKIKEADEIHASL